MEGRLIKQERDSVLGLLVMHRRRLLGVFCLLAMQVQATLPTVVSTNLCADLFALGLVAPTQLLSVSHKSQNPALSPLAIQARRFPANDSSAEEIIALRPDIALVSRRWQSRHQSELFKTHGIRLVSITFPVSWEEIFQSTREVAEQLGRSAAADMLLAELTERLQALRQKTRPFNVVYIRPNGGSAGANTYVDTILTTVGATNHASDQGRIGWGPYPLELLYFNAPDVFLLGSFPSDSFSAKTGYSRHPLLQEMLMHTPQISLAGNHWGCGSWLLIEAAESIAIQLDQLASANKGMNEIVKSKVWISGQAEKQESKEHHL